MQFNHLAKLLFAIPNGGKRNGFEAKNLKNEGVRPGVPDLFLAIPKKGYAGLFLELKKGKNKLTENQSVYFDLLQQNNYLVKIVYSFDEFKKIITEYLNE